MIPEILNRRSIRAYQNTPIPADLIRQVLQAGLLAPSSKNRQPWRFVVVAGKAKEEMLFVMEKGLKREKQEPLLPGSAHYLKGAAATMEIMRQAPAVIFILNRLGLPFNRPLSPEERVYEICNAQSIGAAVENMSLEATRLGLGSLWICDTFFAYRELCGWLQADGELAAALALGYSAESPAQRPRLRLEETVQWRVSS